MSTVVNFRLRDDWFERLEKRASELAMSTGDTAKLAVLTYLAPDQDEEPDESGEVEEDAETLDLANLIVAKYQVARQVAVRWIRGGFIRIDGREGVWKEPTLPVELKDRILAGKELSTAEKKRQRALAKRRKAVALENGIAVGYVDEHCQIMPGARKLPDDVLAARKEAAK